MVLCTPYMYRVLLNLWAVCRVLSVIAFQFMKLESTLGFRLLFSSRCTDRLARRRESNMHMRRFFVQLLYQYVSAHTVFLFQGCRIKTERCLSGVPGDENGEQPATSNPGKAEAYNNQAQV